MERRTAAAIALSVSATVLASGAAFAANVGLLDPAPDPVGKLEVANVGDLAPTTSADGTTPATVIVDIPFDDHGGDRGDDSSDDISGTDDHDGSGDRPTVTTAGGQDDSPSPSTTTAVGSASTTSSTVEDHEDDDHSDDGDDHEEPDDSHDDDD